MRPHRLRPEPTAEEKKKAEDAARSSRQLARSGTTRTRRRSRAGRPRCTPPPRRSPTRPIPSGKAAIQAALEGDAAHAGRADRDKYRHPVETLDFFGFKPTETVLDIGPGEGWFTELLAPALAKKGHYYVTNGDPNGPADQWSTFYAQKLRRVPRQGAGAVRQGAADRR